MSVMTRPSKKAKKITQVQTIRASHETEAPDRGLNREAPESGRIKIAEAPDAGDGRQAIWDHDFTHGRSQS